MAESHEETEQPGDAPEGTEPTASDQPGLSQVARSDELSPVQAPNAGFLIQLFLIPMIIVIITGLIYTLFIYLPHMGSDPRDLARDLRSLNKSSWQKAYTLSDLLRDPGRSELKRDHKLAQELADVLAAELKAARMEDSRIRLRIFLCKCLGEFEIPVGLPQLMLAAELERSPKEIDVRYAALESIAVLAENVGAETLQKDTAVMRLLKEICREYSNDDSQKHQKGELRSTAAFALGVIGGDEALEELNQILSDPYPNARYNAAIGMARHGDLRARNVLMAMLTPDNPQVVLGEKSSSEKKIKRIRVLVNGIRAVRLLSNHHRGEQLGNLRTQLEKLAKADLPKPVVLQAKETLLEIRP